MTDLHIKSEIRKSQSSILEHEHMNMSLHEHVILLCSPKRGKYHWIYFLVQSGDRWSDVLAKTILPHSKAPCYFIWQFCFKEVPLFTFDYLSVSTYFQTRPRGTWLIFLFHVTYSLRRFYHLFVSGSWNQWWPFFHRKMYFHKINFDNRQR